MNAVQEVVARARQRDQSCAPLVEAIRAFGEAGHLPMHVPGHKQGHGVDPETLFDLGLEPFLSNVTTLNGLDDRRESWGVQPAAEQLAADLWGADRSFFLVNGSSSSMQIALASVCGPGEELIIARNVHKSVMNGLIVTGARPVFLQPAFDDELQIAHTPTPEALRDALERHPDARAVVIVCPTYYGVAADTRELADICHAFDRPLVVDDAWGAHFGFHPDLPDSSVECGADIAVSSIHKTLNGLSQSSILSIQGPRVDPQIVAARVGLLQTTSTNSLILASIDATRRMLALNGEQLYTRLLEVVRAARTEIHGLPGLSVLGHEVVGRPGAYGLDETKIVIDVRELGITGYEASDYLRANHGVCLELQDTRRILAVATLGDDAETLRRFVDALRDLATSGGNGTTRSIPAMPRSTELQTQCVMRPRDAYFGPAQRVPLEESEGRIAAENPSPYPPGIPIVACGERITRPIIDYLRADIAAGALLADAADVGLETIRVVAGSPAGVAQ
jgi:arginine decarboxylase